MCKTLKEILKEISILDDIFYQYHPLDMRFAGIMKLGIIWQ